LQVLVIKAQQPLNTDLKVVPFEVYISKDYEESFEDFYKKDVSFQSVSTLTEKTTPNEVYWLRVDFSSVMSTLEQEDEWYFFPRTFVYSTIYLKENNTIIAKKIGAFERGKNQTSKLYESGIRFTKSSLIDGKYIYLKVRRVTYFDRFSRWKMHFATKIQNQLLEEYYSNKDLNKLVPIYIFAGICLVMFIFTLVYFAYSRRPEFLCYTLYVLFLFFYLCSDVLNLHELFFGQFDLISYSFFQVCQVLINLFYILFIIYYLDSRTAYPKLHVALKAIAYMLIIVAVFDTFARLNKWFLINIYVLDAERLIMSVFGLGGMIYLSWKAKSKLAYFVVTGSFLYMIGALAFLFLKNRMYMITGSSLEILIFASGLTYKMQQEYQERIRLQKESFINENRALRAQMNPHFIFNSLSSIQNLITSNKNESAVKYLNKFSLLMRNLLESTFDTNVLLSEEIELLKKYLELESLRFNDTFSYSIILEDDVEPDQIELPALLLQPFVENAILHGLLPKSSSDKKLLISFRKESHFLICEIDDNGVGRKASEASKGILNKGRKSRGIEVTLNRLKLFNEGEDNYMYFIDKLDNEGRSNGTTVQLKLRID